jgi:hypothetical protein
VASKTLAAALAEAVAEAEAEADAQWSGDSLSPPL